MSTIRKDGPQDAREALEQVRDGSAMIMPKLVWVARKT